MTAARFCIFLFKAVAVCVSAGAVVGAAAWTLVGTVLEGDAQRLLYLPVFAFYALPIAIPFGAASGVVAAVAVAVLSREKHRPVGAGTWLRMGTVAGACLGAACPVFLLMAGFGTWPAGEWLLWGFVGGVAGAACGGVVGWLGWRETRDHPVSASPRRAAAS